MPEGHPFVLVFTFIGIILMIRLLLPNLTPGFHKVGLNRITLAWFMHLALSRAYKVCGLENIILCSYVFKFLYWRALGAKVPFQLTSSLGVGMGDAPLITIGKNCVIGDKTDIYCHIFKEQLLYLAPNIIGANVQISASCMIGPGNIIGDHSKLGYGTKLANQNLKAYSKIQGLKSDTCADFDL